MRYATYSLAGDSAPRLGVVRDDRMIDVAAAVRGRWTDAPGTLLALIQQGPDAWARMQDLLGSAGQGGTDQGSAGPSSALAGVRWHAPIPRPLKNIICLGLNYAAHIREGAVARGREVKIPTDPVFFSKLPTTVAGPFDDVVVDTSVTQQVDWEAELGAIIGVAGRNIARADAARHIFGYTVINDVTARDLQARHQQWMKGKSLDGFCPMGPVVVTADEFGDPQQKRVTLRVNGVTKQDGNTADQIFHIDRTIEVFSAGVTLEPGDIISTGTPEGVGFGRTPQEFLHDGDVMETEVEGIGTLRNTIRES
jgi:2-keto-4-pentenoate hydratase/2-oxohepta-3-ene-1,7-dioic acid hydratase in catechol pathway